MSCYVDEPIHPFRGMKMCHLWADSLDELLAMVDRIGVDRRWIQGHPELSLGKAKLASWVHFDIAKGKRALAIQAGAIEMDRYACAYHDAKQKGRERQMQLIEELRERAGRPKDGIVRLAATADVGGGHE